MNDQPRPESPSAGSAATAPLEALRFLLGHWQAINEPGEATGSFSFVAQLQSRVIVRTNHADYPPSGEQPAYRHEDLMVLYADESPALRADYFDNEGHVLRYSGHTPGPGEVVLTTDPGAGGPGFRLSYRLDDDQELLHGLFEISPPGQADAFQVYRSWSARREVLG